MRNNGMGQWMVKLLSLIPYVVSGIEQIHGDAKSGAEKKQLALESLGLAAAGAEAVAPASDDPAIAAATQLASDAIDGVKAVYNAAKGNIQPPATSKPVIAPITQQDSAAQPSGN